MPPRKSTSRELQPPAGSGIPVTPSLAASLNAHTPNPAKRLKAADGASASLTPMHPPPMSSRKAAAAGPGSGSGSRQATSNNAVASTSRVTLDSIPPVDWPETLTPGYKKPEGTIQSLSEEERGRLIHELVGFYPRTLLESVNEEARRAGLEIAEHVEMFMRQLAHGHDEAKLTREVDIGIYAFETLLSSHVDRAFDQFTGWAQRNTFEVPDDVEVVMPWCKDIDFDRGAYVAALPDGEETVLQDLEKARKKVEQMRYLSQQLERAEKVLDRRLDIARQRKGEVGFVGEALEGANLQPLLPTLTKTKTQLALLHDVLSPMTPLPPAAAAGSRARITSGASAGAGAGAAPGQKAWEMGRQQYLSWAVGKALAAAGQGAGAASQALGASASATREARDGHLAQDGSLEGVERALRQIGGQEEVDAASRAL